MLSPPGPVRVFKSHLAEAGCHLPLGNTWTSFPERTARACCHGDLEFLHCCLCWCGLAIPIRAHSFVWDTKIHGVLVTWGRVRGLLSGNPDATEKSVCAPGNPQCSPTQETEIHLIDTRLLAGFSCVDFEGNEKRVVPMPSVTSAVAFDGGMIGRDWRHRQRQAAVGHGNHRGSFPTRRPK